MREEEINWVYIRSRLRMVVPDCFITDELLKEVYKMLVEIYGLGVEKGKEKDSELTLTRENGNI